MPIGSIIGGLIGQQGALQSGAAAGAAGERARQGGEQAWTNAQGIAQQNRAASSGYTDAGYAGTNALLRALSLGHLNPMSRGQFSYGDTSLNTDSVAGDRAGALSDFQASPGYQWRVDQGTKALDRSAASRGMVNSGAQQQAVTDYGQKQASGEWDNYIKSLFGLSGQGASATNATSALNTSALNQGNALAQKGNELGFQGDMGQASQYASGANALASGIGKGIQNGASLAMFGLGGGFGGFGDVGGASGLGSGTQPNGGFAGLNPFNSLKNY